MISPHNNIFPKELDFKSLSTDRKHDNKKRDRSKHSFGEDNPTKLIRDINKGSKNSRKNIGASIIKAPFTKEEQLRSMKLLMRNNGNESTPK
jgi:hypothetical protein